MTELNKEAEANVDPSQTSKIRFFAKIVNGSSKAPSQLFHWVLSTPLGEFNFKLTLPVPRILESCIEIKNKLNFYFHTSLWCLKRFYEGL